MANEFNIAEIFGNRVFNKSLLKESLSQKAFAQLEQAMNGEAELSLETAEEVASAMKNWALSHGATHFTHWFQPLTGVTAEKHVSFISEPTPEGKVISEFSGKELVRGELDASSFPNGGLRATFEARGYTMWDCTSPAFLKEDACGCVLCIPTAFCSYSGDALDLKTPLLRSMDAVNKAALRVLRVLGNKTSNKVIPMSGAEQEYFLISREKFEKRKDIMYTGRTLFGVMPAKDQETAAHYSGSISERIGAFMKAVNNELWKSGVPAKIQHNEFAPGQHEICPIYTTANIASDQNQLIMETLKKVAERQDLKCLLHEKPFKGINGSGKHNNWSLVTDDGINLMHPGKTESENLRFLLVISCMIKAVDTHADLLRLSASGAGNDYRLGGEEAPPVIISMFIGDTLLDELKNIADHKNSAARSREKLNTGVPFIPAFNKDLTDRNRTSPFAFNGNRFEFRTVGSGDSVAGSSTVLNCIAAEAFNEAADILEKSTSINKAVYRIIRNNFTKHGRIIFNGNGYSNEWTKEAKKRGLNSLASTVEAIPALTSASTIKLMEDLNVFTERELFARSEIRYETYAKQLQIESKTMLNMTRKQILPAVIAYTKDLAAAINEIKQTGIAADTSVQESLLISVSDLLKEAGSAAIRLEKAIEKAEKETDIKKKATLFRNEVLPGMEDLRSPLDRLEKCVDKRVWPLPSYGDILFEI